MKVFLNQVDLSPELESIFEKKKFTLVDAPESADILIYDEDIEPLLEKCHGTLRACAIIPVHKFISNGGIDGPEIKSQSLLGAIEFADESVGSVALMIGELMEQFQSSEHFSDISRFMKANAVELVQNALIYKRQSASEGKISLEVYETPKFYNVQVTDSFGALSQDKILEKLVRAWRDKTYELKESGAGLGLFMTMMASDSMIFRLKNTERTQVCCIINKYKRLKHYKNKSPALYISKE
ncbi:MAG: ATP-binding protein [Bacteriovoracaceae bacterium]|nr:ATP-binding protein [Bacteriovoracaceae bacterium]